MPLVVELQESGAAQTARYIQEFGAGLSGALARALNRAIEGGRTVSTRALQSEAGLAPKYGRRALSLTRATPGTLSAILTAKGRRLPLVAYVGTKGFRSGRGIAGLAYRLGAVPSGSFFAQLRSGHRGIFVRVGRARVPIKAQTGPSIPELVVSKRIFEAARVRALEVYRERLDHEVGRLRERRGA